MRKKITKLLTIAMMTGTLLHASPATLVNASTPNQSAITLNSNLPFTGPNYVIRANVNFRSGPSVNYSKIGYLRAGTKVNYLGQANNKWSKVQVNGKTGYISSSYLTFPNATPTAGETYTVVSRVNFRTGPSTRYNVIKKLYPGQDLTVIAKVNSTWYKVNVNNTIGYISSKYIKAKDNISNAGNSSNNTYKVLKRVNFRTGPSTRYNVIRKLYPGDKVELLSKYSSTWYKVRANGEVGYISSNYIAPESYKSSPSNKVAPKMPANSLGFKGGQYKTVMNMRKWEGTAPYADPKYKRFVHTPVSVVQSLMDQGNIVRWGAPVDNYDGMTTWIMGHGSGVFRYLRDGIKKGSLIDVTDENNKLRTYKIMDIQKNTDGSWDTPFYDGSTIYSIYTDGGKREGIIIQLCQPVGSKFVNHFYYGIPTN